MFHPNGRSYCIHTTMTCILKKKTTWTTVHRRSWRFVSFNVLRHCLKYTVTVVFTCIQFFLLWQWLFHAKVAKHVVLPQRGVNFQFFWFDATNSVRMFFLDGVGHSSSSSFARNFLGVVVPRLCLPHHLYKSMYIYTQYIVRNAGVHLALPFIFVLKVHWLWQKAFQILPTSL